MWKYCGHNTFQIKLVKKEPKKKKKNESGTKSLTKKKKNSPLAHSSTHSLPNINKAPNLLLTYSKSKNKKQKAKQIYIILLGSKDLRSYVFRTLMCIVGKPWSKQDV